MHNVIDTIGAQVAAVGGETIHECFTNKRIERAACIVACLINGPIGQ
jgi:hypothetical protein